MENTNKEKILITGATGYVGKRLLRNLEGSGTHLRCLVRRPEVLEGTVAPNTELFKGDILDAESVKGLCKDVTTAYYLVHSMGSAGSFRAQDFKAAKIFLHEALNAGVKRIIYLGGLGEGDHLSDHLESRQEIGRLFRCSSIPTVEFRASIIIGSGSLSFEIIRALVQKLPVMTAPKWVRTLTQPIAIDDVIRYLVAAADLKMLHSELVEIGGPDQVTYQDMLLEYAHQRGLKRYIIPIPLLSPKISSLWLDFVTPIYARIGQHLIEGLRNQTIVTRPRAKELFDFPTLGVKEAIALALSKEDLSYSETSWSDAFSSTGLSSRHDNFGRRIIDTRYIEVECAQIQAFQPIEEIGGKRGWYYAKFLWRVRGFLDRLIGGVGLRRGRRDRKHIRVGDAIDFWRVEKYEANTKLLLRAEMKLPGRAWLQFEVRPKSEHVTSIYQTAIFDPIGIWGLVYWYALYPLHALIFKGMLKQIAKAARQSHPADIS